jgi:hypothetical protein
LLFVAYQPSWPHGGRMRKTLLRRMWVKRRDGE